MFCAKMGGCITTTIATATATTTITRQQDFIMYHVGLCVCMSHGPWPGDRIIRKTIMVRVDGVHALVFYRPDENGHGGMGSGGLLLERDGRPDCMIHHDRR